MAKLFIRVLVAQRKLVSTALTCGVAFLCSPAPAVGQELFREDFERGLTRWRVTEPEWHTIADSGDPAHGKVLKMEPGGGTHSFALIRGAEDWSGVRVEGEVLFPDDGDSYLGLIYNYAERDGRIDYASIYIKGNGSYVQANPRLDGNPMRALLPEYLLPLRGSAAIVIRQWQRFRAEVIGSMCHFYVGDMQRPVVTFDFPYLDRGPIGFKPRVAGDPVWLDNVFVTAISSLAYTGPPIPDRKYRPRQLITDWDAIGPFSGRIAAIENGEYQPAKSYSESGRAYRWQKFATDARGAVITSRLVEFMGPRNRAYFHTTLRAEESESIQLQFSSVDELLLWVNGKFWGYLTPTDAAWFDFKGNPERADRLQVADVQLMPGENHILIMTNSGAYADAGFFAGRSGAPASPVGSDPRAAR